MRLSEILESIRRLTKTQIEEVLIEWDQISREKFLEIHQVYPAQKYWIKHGDKAYDARRFLSEHFESQTAH